MMKCPKCDSKAVIWRFRDDTDNATECLDCGYKTRRKTK